MKHEKQQQQRKYGKCLTFFFERKNRNNQPDQLISWVDIHIYFILSRYFFFVNVPIIAIENVAMDTVFGLVKLLQYIYINKSI